MKPYRFADLLAELHGGDEVDDGRGGEPEGLEVGVERARVLLQVERGKDEFVDGAAGVVDQVHQLAVVRAGLEAAGEQAERRVLREEREGRKVGSESNRVTETGSA